MSLVHYFFVITRCFFISFVWKCFFLFLVFYFPWSFPLFYFVFFFVTCIFYYVVSLLFGSIFIVEEWKEVAFSFPWKHENKMACCCGSARTLILVPTFCFLDYVMDTLKCSKFLRTVFPFGNSALYNFNCSKCVQLFQKLYCYNFVGSSQIVFDQNEGNHD